MTARNGSAEGRENVETGSATVTVGDDVFEGAYSDESRFGHRVGSPQRTRPVSPLVPRSSRRLALVLEHMRSRDRVAQRRNEAEGRGRSYPARSKGDLR
jgi:hypothetical protein